MSDETNTVTEIGVVVEFEGRFWGCVWEDGQSTEYGWVDIKRADLSDPKYTKQPSDKLHEGSWLLKKINKGTLRKIRRTTSYEFIE